ncbi:MAG TPA: lactate utilization protein C [Longimicrobiaceae bacterium]|nr:lactate utilization protein C [Longimicrobiaceae bacterium]
MSSAREEVLGRVRAALAAAPPRPVDDGMPAYRRSDGEPHEAHVALFIERAADYRAEVRRVPRGAEGEAIADALRRRGVRRLAVPSDLPADWLPAGVELLVDRDGGLSHAELDASDGVLTGCALAIAQTGTVVLDGGAAQGRRALTLLPDYHLCVVDAGQIVGLVPEAIERLAGPGAEERRPVTFVSGPSATSDIELNRVEGVHGPRTLQIVVVG